MKFVYELMKEELTDDPWAWRKYGQKPIKGSPFLRNYYRCSTSKGCQAKKQIEKSPKAENLFLVTYCDEHNHPPPTKRCFVTSCNACSKSKLPKGINIVPKELILTSSPSSSKLSKRSRVVASPISPAMPTLGFESAAEEKGEDEEERVVLIPNKSVNEDILMSFEELQVVAGSI
ncbi:hypothetical protein HAX54_034472 [Datura stramonium]|uniref:WRKY domain-containing protein n=1 Tax=Datura stramonium TaxID=4076 RepID=A0ABS8SED0_DATST|nr:hypothetical protein [Datura stramonium]